MCKKPARTGTGRRRTTCVWGRGLEAFTGRLQKSLFFVESEAGWKKMARRSDVACDERFPLVRASAGTKSSAAAITFEQAPLFDERESGFGYLRIQDGRRFRASGSAKCPGRNVRHSTDRVHR